MMLSWRCLKLDATVIVKSMPEELLKIYIKNTFKSCFKFKIIKKIKAVLYETVTPPASLTVSGLKQRLERELNVLL